MAISSSSSDNHFLICGKHSAVCDWQAWQAGILVGSQPKAFSPSDGLMKKNQRKQLAN